MKVMIVDDEPDIRMLFEAALLCYGHEVSLFEDGDVAVEAVQAVDPAVILLDWRMPRMGGEQALPALRRRSQAKIIVVSAYVARSAEFLEAGADAVLRKPLDFDELEAVIQRLAG